MMKIYYFFLECFFFFCFERKGKLLVIISLILILTDLKVNGYTFLHFCHFYEGKQHFHFLLSFLNDRAFARMGYTL